MTPYEEVILKSIQLYMETKYIEDHYDSFSKEDLKKIFAKNLAVQDSLLKEIENLEVRDGEEEKAKVLVVEELKELIGDTERLLAVLKEKIKNERTS